MGNLGSLMRMDRPGPGLSNKNMRLNSAPDADNGIQTGIEVGAAIEYFEPRTCSLIPTRRPAGFLDYVTQEPAQTW